MVSVDDLIISLRIEDTSNLGKLQKQLTTLVGPRGEKKMDLGGIDPGLKRDLEIIRDRIVKFTPTVLVGENIKEAAVSLAGDLRTNKNLTDVMLQRYNININKYESFIEELLNIATGISEQNDDQAKGFIAEMTKFRMIATMKKGERETMVKKITRMMLERGLHKKIVNVFREAGVKMLSKPLMFELTKKSIGKGFDDVIKEAELGEEKDKFAELKEIFNKNSDMLKATSEAYEYMKGEVFDITEITQDMIEKDKDLRLIIIAQVAAGIEKSNWMVEQFYKAAKSYFTKGKAFGVAGAAELDTVIHKLSQELMDKIGLEHVVGDKIDENMINFLGEVKTVAGKAEADMEFTKRVVKQGQDRLFFFFTEFTDGFKNYIEEQRLKEEYKGKKIGGYKITARLSEKLLGIAPDLDEMLKTAKETLEEQKEEDKKTEKEKEEQKEVFAALDELTALSGDLDEVPDSVDEIKKAMESEKKAAEKSRKIIEDIKKTTEDTNKEVKKEDINGEDKVEKLPGDGE